MNHLEIVRRIQEDTGGFTAFIPGHSAGEHQSGQFIKERRRRWVSADAGDFAHLPGQFQNVQSSWVTQAQDLPARAAFRRQ
jgi:2-iminoacetate synthase ThiH